MIDRKVKNFYTRMTRYCKEHKCGKCVYHEFCHWLGIVRVARDIKYKHREAITAFTSWNDLNNDDRLIFQKDILLFIVENDTKGVISNLYREGVA